MTIAIIPARAGSKGIKNKNIQPIKGVPLVAHSVITARNAELIDEVYVSTDGDEIARIAETHGAKVIRQPERVSGDKNISEMAILYLLDQLDKVPEFFVFLQCTCPLTMPQDIDGAIEKFLSTKADTLLAVSRFNLFIWEEDDNGEAIAVSHNKSVRLQRQLMKPQYIENGNFYIINTAKFRECRHRFFGKTVLYEMPVARSFDINTEIDLKIAASLMDS